MQVKLLFSKSLPKTQKTTKNNKTRKLSSHAGKTLFFEFLGCENHVRGSPLGDAFWYNSWCFFVFFFVVFSSLRPERYFMDFYAILSLFSTPFLEFFCSKVEVVFFATLPSKTMIFKVPGLLFFSVFFQSFPHSIPDLIFLVFLVILGSPRLPFWSLWA